MDFNRFGQNRPANRNNAVPAEQAQAAKASGAFNAGNANNAAAAQQQPVKAAGKGDFKEGRAYRWSFLALLLSGTVLAVATIFFIVYGRSVYSETHYVKADQYQAVFVNVNGTNGGQVYFGKIRDLTSQYIRLTDVFYIQNQTGQDGAANGSYNLVKLGCELHGPNDEMLINRSEVFFWENLKNDGQVAQKAAEFKKNNPNGQKCDTNSGSTQQGTGTTQAPATGTNGEATGAGAAQQGAGTTTNNAAGTTTNNAAGATTQKKQ